MAPMNEDSCLNLKHPGLNTRLSEFEEEWSSWSEDKSVPSLQAHWEKARKDVDDANVECDRFWYELLATEIYHRNKNGLDLRDMGKGSTGIGQVGSYRPLRLIDAGGMGAVFEAVEITLQRHDALKVMLPELAHKDRFVRTRFLREARYANSIKGKHAVTIYSVARDAASVPFIAMELLHGESLKARIERVGKMEGQEIVALGRQIVEGLESTHSKNLIHRDLKPANIYLELDDNVKILDFGLAKLLDEQTQLTQLGDVLGTPSFMSPEQVSGGQVDRRCDLFSLGSVLYYMATGVPPFSGTTGSEVRAAVVQATPVPVLTINPDLPKSVASLIMKLLEKNPADRPESAAKVADTLQHFQFAPPPPSAPAKPAADRDGRQGDEATVPASETQQAAPVRQKHEPGVRDVAIDVPGTWIEVDHRGTEIRRVETPATVQIMEQAPSELPWPEDVYPFRQYRFIVASDVSDFDLQGLANLGHLHAFDLSGCAAVTDAGLACLDYLVNLRELDLSCCSALTDEGLRPLENLTLLERLSLASCDNVTDGGLAHIVAHIVGLTKLTELDLSCCNGLTDAGLASLSGLTQLEALNLGGCAWLTDAGLDYLRSLRQLKRLSLSCKKGLTSPWLGPLYHLLSLKHLDLSCWNFDADHGRAALVHVKFMMGLEGLDLTSCKGLKDRRLEGILEKCGYRLRRLRLASCEGPTDGALAKLAEHNSLCLLDLSGCIWLTNAGLTHLTNMTFNLKELNLAGCENLTNPGLANLRQLYGLRKLHLEGCTWLTGAGLAQLRGLKDLKVFSDILMEP